MSAGSVLIMIAEHLRIVRANPSPTTRENMLMSSLSRLSTVMDKLVTDVQTGEANLATANASLTEKDTEISDLKTKLAAAEAAPTTGISEADAEALIAKGEAVVGPVPDDSAPGGTGTDTLSGAAA